MESALIPISVGNQRFSTDYMLRIITPILNKYQNIYFLVADKLHIYNKVRKGITNNSISFILNDYRNRNRDYELKEIWINRILGTFNKRDRSYKIFGIDDVTRENYFEIYRNIQILFNTHEQFRTDVINSANKYLSNKNIQNSKLDSDLSVLYILEEIAINIKLRVASRIYSEYYSESYHPPLINLYKNKYECSISDIVGEKINSLNFKFYNYNDEAENWKECN